MRYIKLYESFSSDKIEDIKDIFLELEDSGFILNYKSLKNDSRYSFSDEFLIYKKGDSGYYLNGDEIGLFDINEVIDEFLRFVDICQINADKYRLIIDDGQYTLDITDKIDNLDKINRDDVISKTHLHLKSTSGTAGMININNIKFCSGQIMK